jgi:catechol 2,3-dioxygenase-like lactoylglutathione lyase family enzyme
MAIGVASVKAKDAAHIEPALKLRFLSHGTLASRDLDKSRQFYEEFLGLDVIRTSPVSLMIRLGGPNTIAVVRDLSHTGGVHLNHNGLDVETQEEVDAAYKVVIEQQEKWGITKISKPLLQHGTYAFFFADQDENWWEILTNPQGGYSWLFEKGGDLEGKGHQDKAFARPGVKL